MRIAVVGAGAIGVYVGACLARGGADVHLVARGDNLAALRRNGITVLSPRGDFAAHPPATGDPEEIGSVDVVFLGLKAFQYADARPLLEPLLHPDTAIVAAQNGIPWWYFHGLKGPYEGRRIEAVDPDGAVSAVICPDRAIGCVVYPAAFLEAPGVVRHVEGTRFSIGEPDGTTSDRCLRFAEAMVAGGLKCPVEPDIRKDLWIKLMGNVVFNPISALTGATLREICVYPPTRALAAEVMREAIAVALALGTDPELEVERRLDGAERVGDHKPSTLQDLEAGKPLELSAIVGAVLELAALAEVDVPHMGAIGAAVTLLAATRGLQEPAPPKGRNG